MNNKEIGIIIPVYNSSESLERCVESIVYGELRNIDIILIEDCSQDNSWEICCALAERFENVQCIQNKRNSGISCSRNRGLEMIDSKYILFVDSNDWVSGRFAKKMLDTVKKYPDSLVICGVHIRNDLAGNYFNYTWDSNIRDENLNVIEKKYFWDLQERGLLRELRNKIFRYDTIKRYGLRFDETLDKGGDFQFVLDYIEVAQIEQSVVLNTPLYYHVQSKNSFPVNKLSLIEIEKECECFEKLKDICITSNMSIEEKFQKLVKQIKNNYIYQICRDASLRDGEKLDYIEKVMHDVNAIQYFKEQQKRISKEQICQLIERYKHFSRRVIGKVKREKNKIIIKKARFQLKNSNFSVISQNCIGGVFYHDMEIQFLSPTINLFFKEPDFVRFVQNLHYYINLEIEMYWEEEYPIGILDDVTVYFMHYGSCHEAKMNWDKRKKRINWDKIIILATDMEGFNDNVWEEWNKIPYPKMLFTSRERKSLGTVYLKKYRNSEHVPDLIPNREFYKKGVLIRNINRL